MAKIDNQTVTVDMPGRVAITFRASYEVEIERGNSGWDDGEWYDDGPAATIVIHYVDIMIGGKVVGEIEGKDIPKDLRDWVEAAIDVSDEEINEALGDEDDDAEFQRDHAAGRI